MPSEGNSDLLSKRQRQIDFAKNTVAYGKYIQAVRIDSRIKDHHPQTPNKYQKCSSRSWEGQMKKWKSQLHQWNPPNYAKVSLPKVEEKQEIQIPLPLPVPKGRKISFADLIEPLAFIDADGK